MSNEIVLDDVLKGYTLDQDKVLPPRETVRRFREKLSKIDLDILEETVRIDQGRLDIPVYFSVCGRDAAAVIGTKKQMGKGGTPEQAEASAVMELAERFSFFSFANDPRNFVFDTYEKLADKALPFEVIAKSVHDDSPDLEIAEKFFAQIPMRWTWGYNLTEQRKVLIPFDWFFSINEFNGPSAGNCKEEAILQGLCEVVERHVSSLVSRNFLSVPAIDLTSSTDPVARELIDKYLRVGVKLYGSDFSLDTGIPTVGILAYDPSTFPERSEIVWTAGTTPNPEKALIRALTEVAQLAGDFNTSSNYVASGLPKFKSLQEANFITNAPDTVKISELPDLSDKNLRVEIENCVSALSNIGLEVMVIDITHAELEVPAYYTIVPGAHFRERAVGTSVSMFTAKLIAQSQNKIWAINMLREMDKLLPNRYFIKFFLGLCYLDLGEPSQAIPFLRDSLGLEPKHEDIPTIYSYLGICHKELGQYNEALQVLKEALKWDQERTDIYNLMGFCYFKLKKHEKAIDCFKEVVRLNPGSAIDYANIGSNYRDMGKKEKAIEYYRLALELDPSIDFARENLEKLEGL